MLRSKSTPEFVVDAVRDDIQSGRLAPGAALRQEELADRFSTSRIPIREALLRLEAEGIVVNYPNRGAFVVKLSAEDLREITDLRVLIEGDLFYRAICQASPDDLAQVHLIVDLAETTASTPDWPKTDRLFHQTLYAPARRPRQLEMAMALRAAVERYSALYPRLSVKIDDWLQDHRDMVDAFARRDAVAGREALARHIEQAGAFLVAQLLEEEAA